MILSDADIIERLAAGDLVISPLVDPDRQIQPASVDLRLSPEFRFEKHEYRLSVMQPDDDVLLMPGAFALGSTIERVRVPNDLVARVEGRSSLGRLGLMVHVTAGFVDPGFDGQITLELKNISNRPIRLGAGSYVTQVVFEQLRTPCARPYGHPSRSSKYQGQVGPVASRLER